MKPLTATGPPLPFTLRVKAPPYDYDYFVGP